MTTILPFSDQPIPAAHDITARAVELRAAGIRQNDPAAVRQAERVIVGVACGAQASWQIGALLITSITTPGNVYRVRCGACTCQARKPCWHIALCELLIELFTDVVTADDAA